MQSKILKSPNPMNPNTDRFGDTRLKFHRLENKKFKP